MKLKDFTAETLKEIIDGVIEAQKYYSEKGGAVGSRMYAFEKKDVIKDLDTGRPAHFVDFDVAVTTNEGTETKGGIGVFVGPIGVGSQGQTDKANSSYSRIKYSIPVFLPVQKDKE